MNVEFCQTHFLHQMIWPFSLNTMCDASQAEQYELNKPSCVSSCSRPPLSISSPSWSRGGASSEVPWFRVVLSEWMQLFWTLPIWTTIVNNHLIFWRLFICKARLPFFRCACHSLPLHGFLGGWSLTLACHHLLGEASFCSFILLLHSVAPKAIDSLNIWTFFKFHVTPVHLHINKSVFLFSS